MTLTELVQTERSVITVDELASVLEVGRSAAYEAVDRGQVPGVIRVGRRIRISVPALVAWLAPQPEQDHAA